MANVGGLLRDQLKDIFSQVCSSTLCGILIHTSEWDIFLNNLPLSWIKITGFLDLYIHMKWDSSFSCAILFNSILHSSSEFQDVNNFKISN